MGGSSLQNEQELLNSAVNDFIALNVCLYENPGDIAYLGKAASALSRCARIIVLPVASPQSNASNSSAVGAYVHEKCKASFMSSATSFVRAHLSSASTAVSETIMDELDGNLVDSISMVLLGGIVL
jgi:hypothetical protein